MKGQSLVGVVDTSTYHETQKGQVLCVEKYAQTSDIMVGDELFFAGNGGEGSGVVTKLYIAKGYVAIKTNGQLKNVALNTVIGKVVEKNDGWGYVVWFFQSWFGIVVLNAALIAIVLLRTVLGFTTEASLKGRELQQRLFKQKLANKKFRRMYKNYARTGLDIETFELLDGDFEENKQKITDFAKYKDLPNAYKYLLQKVHRVYVGKHKLSVLDRKKITNCVELMCLVDKFDVDSEYMLTDLILKTHLVNFDMENYLKSCSEYLTRLHKIEDIECFETVFYVLIKKNKHLRDYEVYQFCDELETYLCKQNYGQKNAHLLNLFKYIKKLI